MTSCLYVGMVRHRRSRPTVHLFRYRSFLFYLDLDELTLLDRALWPFSLNRFNLVSFYDRDHLDGRDGVTKTKVLAFLRRSGLELSAGKVFLLTSCRVFGHVFNPISLYYCHGESGDLEAVVAEVHNTFGEQYLYVLHDGTALGHQRTRTHRYRVAKALHVSPFISMDAVYDFHLPPVGARLAVGIVEHEAGAHVLDAQLWGDRVPLTTATLGRVLLAQPLSTLKTVAAIHGEALRLFVKGVPLHRQPPPSQAQRDQTTRLTDLP